METYRLTGVFFTIFPDALTVLLTARGVYYDHKA